MKKTVLVTGATGFLGQFVVNELLEKEDYNVLAIGGRPEDKVNPLPDNPRLNLFTLEELFDNHFVEIDTVINCAFARSNAVDQLAQTLDFTEKLIKRLEELKVLSVINMSSQGVYKRLPVGTLSTEDSPIEPIDLYSMAKYASEKMFRVSSIPYVTNVRLASLMMPQRFLYFFVQKACNREPFTVTAPNQYAALLDATDAASGLVHIVSLDKPRRAKTYNLGLGTQYSLIQYAESVKRIGKQLGYDVLFDVNDSGISVCAGMDSSKLMKDTGWKPLVMKDEMVTRLFKSIGE
ncbi:MAG: NAD(P)-dependent oxidoreductase [Bacteroidales bacterium]|nr:NAD(P)-dependent oxidoreductase [Bacteroidales bacterium]